MSKIPPLASRVFFPMIKKIRLGFIPEHYSTPIHFSKTQKFFSKRGLDVDLIPYPSGSGHLIQSLNNKELDAAVGLTEAFIRGTLTSRAKYSIVGTYVESPLHWAVSTGAKRDDLHNMKQLQGKRIGVSRIGSGSYVMSFVLALQEGFNSKKPFADFPVCHTFERLRKSVNDCSSDAFMWEYFTTKKYYLDENPELKMLGSVYTPWPSWVLVRHQDLEHQITLHLAESLDEGISYFQQHPVEAIEYIKTLGYSEADGYEWLNKVRFSKCCHAPLNKTTVDNVIHVLRTAQVT